MKKVLIAGGAGFIGSHLCEALLHEGYSVLCVDSFITSNKENVSNLLGNPNFSLLEHNVVEELAVKLPEKIDAIFHLASPASPNKNSKRSYIAFPIETLLVNSQGTYNLLELAKEMDAKFLFASTSEIYGDPQITPQPESYWGNVNPNGIRSVYDESKRYGEAITMAYVRKFNLDARIIRIFNTYGPRMQKDDGRVVSNFINQAIQGSPITMYGEGKQTRSFCYIDDMVEGIKKMMFYENTKGEVVNLGNPEERTVAELAHTIRSLTDSKSEIVQEELPEDDPKSRRPDISKAQHLLDWSPRVTLEEGLMKTIEYFKSI